MKCYICKAGLTAPAVACMTSVAIPLPNIILHHPHINPEIEVLHITSYYRPLLARPIYRMA